MQPNLPISKYNIAIVGLGPKGLYAFAELVGFLKERSIQNVNVYLFEKSKYFGTGPIYNIDQAPYLLMNYENVHIDHSPLYISEDRRKNYIQFAAPLQRFSARAKVGRYLKDLYEELTTESKAHLNAQEVSDEVVNIKKIYNKFCIETTKNLASHILFDKVMITTGHHTCRPSEYKAVGKINFIYPPEKQFKPITCDDIVAIKGLGLTFIDAVLGLTEGKGGRFEEDGSKLKYIKSGNEPQKIIPFSRSGEFMLPRKRTTIPDNFKFKGKLIKKLTSEVKAKIDFEREIIPALEEEFNLQNGHGNFLNAIHLSAYSIGQLIDIAEGKMHPEIVLASLIWRKFVTDFNKIYSNFGLSPNSHYKFDTYWKGKMQRLCYGPPLINFKKIQAIQEDGLLDLNFLHSPELDCDSNEIRNIVKGISRSFTYLVDARIPSNDLRNNPSKLFKNMLNAGLIRLANNEDYEIGCIDLNKYGQAFDRDGKVVRGLSFYGTMTEGLTYNNDTLSIDHNNYARPWVMQIKKEIANEYNYINTNPSRLDKKNIVASGVAEEFT